MKDILLFSAYCLLQTMAKVNFPPIFYILFCYCGEFLFCNRKHRINLQIISMHFFSDAMNVYFHKVSVGCSLPHYLILINLFRVDKAQSTQSNHSRIPIKSQEYKITPRYFGDLNIWLEWKDWDFCCFVLFGCKEAIWYS